MKLDKRIKDNRIGDCFNTDGFTEYLTQPCYFANNIDDFKDLNSCKYANLVFIAQDRASAYYTALNDADSWKFCLPAAYVEPGSEQKTLRPFRTVKELPFTVGDILFLKDKESPTINKCICSSITCIDDRISLITLGTIAYSVQELFENYRWKFTEFTETGDWNPFGEVVDGN